MTQIMNSTGLTTLFFVFCFFFVNYFLFNDIITKINICKTDHQSNIRAFVWECNNLIKNKLKKYEDIQNQLNNKKKLKKKAKNDPIKR